MFENDFHEENIKLTPKKRLFIEQNAYKRAQEYFDRLSTSNQEREKEIRHRNTEIIKKKQNLVLLKGSLPSSIEIQKIKKENEQIQIENDTIQNLINKIKSQIKQYNDLYSKLDSDFQNKLLEFCKLEQMSIDHSFTAEQLKNIHLKAIKKYEKVFQKENDLINLLISLQQREKIVLKKEKKLDLILSEPLDNIELDDFLTQDVENSLSDLESTDNFNDDESKLISDVEKELNDLEILIKSNKSRQKKLSIQKSYISSQSQISFSSFTNSPSRKINEHEKDLTILNNKDKADINTKIENIIQTLHKKNRKCLDDSLEVDQLSIVNFQKIKEFEKQFQIKKLKIQNLKDQIEFINVLNSSVKDEQNKILLLTRQLSNMKNEKEQIKYANLNANQSRKIFESKKEDLKKLKSLLNIKINELNEKESKIKKRKIQFNKDQAMISSQMIELEMYEEKINNLEEQVKVYEDKIRDNCNEINKNYSIIDEQSKLSLNNNHSFRYSDSFDN